MGLPVSACPCPRPPLAPGPLTAAPGPGVGAELVSLKPSSLAGTEGRRALTPESLVHCPAPETPMTGLGAPRPRPLARCWPGGSSMAGPLLALCSSLAPVQSSALSAQNLPWTGLDGRRGKGQQPESATLRSPATHRLACSLCRRLGRLRSAAHGRAACSRGRQAAWLWRQGSWHLSTDNTATSSSRPVAMSTVLRHRHRPFTTHMCYLI